MLVRTLAVGYPSGTVLEHHEHDWAQLVYASEGVMSVHTDEGTWVVPSHRAVWIPAGVRHSVAMSGWVSMRTLYILPRLVARLPGRCCVVVAQVGISGSTVLEDFVRVGGQAAMAGHLRIGQGTEIGAQAGVMSAPRRASEMVSVPMWHCRCTPRSPLMSPSSGRSNRTTSLRKAGSLANRSTA